MTKEEFKNQTGRDLIEKDGKLYYDGNLDLHDLLIESLPDDITIYGDLDLSINYIKELPKNLTVKGSLYLNHNKIKSLPNDLIVGGSLDLSFTMIESLPDNLTVNGDLCLSDNNIEKLPNNLTVNGNFILLDTSIKELPDDLIVNGNYILITNENIKYKPEKIGFIFSKEFGDEKNIACYNIKKDIMKHDFFQNSFDEFMREFHEKYIVYGKSYKSTFNKFIDKDQFDLFTQSCNLYRNMFLKNISKPYAYVVIFPNYIDSYSKFFIATNENDIKDYYEKLGVDKNLCFYIDFDLKESKRNLIQYVTGDKKYVNNYYDNVTYGFLINKEECPESYEYNEFKVYDFKISKK